IVGDDALLREWLGQSQTLVGKEEERFVFEDRGAKYSAKVILMFLRFLEVIEVHKPVTGVERAIPEIFEERSMKGIRSGARRDRDLPTRCASELRSERRGLHAKLLHRIH